MGRMSRLLRDLAGRRDGVFVELLNAQVDCGLSAARALRQAVEGERPLDEGVVEVARVAEEADHARDRLVAELNRSLTTPLDREDLFRFSRSLDDIVDNLHDHGDTMLALRVADPSGCAPPLDALVTGLQALRRAVTRIGSDEVAAIPAAARQAKRASGVREAFVAALADLFAEPVTGDVLARRELLRRLDVTGLRLDEAADALADAALKRA